MCIHVVNYCSVFTCSLRSIVVTTGRLLRVLPLYYSFITLHGCTFTSSELVSLVFGGDAAIIGTLHMFGILIQYNTDNTSKRPD